MRKIIILFLICTLLFLSCEKETKYIPLPGEYTLKCQISDVEYDVKITLDEALSGKLTFSSASEMCDWEFYYSSEDKSIKYFTSLGEVSEAKLAKNENVKYLFKFVLCDFDNISDVSHNKISGIDVSVLKTTDGVTVYTDSASGRPLRIETERMTADIISHPQGQ
ncbi:MAG: hypothetical protein E7633_01920 [Ruminococcaceae bacterium]|nr:hypothetical protein [Oscillospiraceae bacterium]